MLVEEHQGRQDVDAGGLVVRLSYNQLLINKKGAHKLGWDRSGFFSSVS